MTRSYDPDDFYDDGVHPGGPDDTPDEYWEHQDFPLPDGYKAPPPVSNAWGGNRGSAAALMWERLGSALDRHNSTGG